jgi:hypothetical protein
MKKIDIINHKIEVEKAKLKPRLPLRKFVVKVDNVIYIDFSQRTKK